MIFFKKKETASQPQGEGSPTPALKSTAVNPAFQFPKLNSGRTNPGKSTAVQQPILEKEVDFEVTPPTIVEETEALAVSTVETITTAPTEETPTTPAPAKLSLGGLFKKNKPAAVAIPTPAVEPKVEQPKQHPITVDNEDEDFNPLGIGEPLPSKDDELVPTHDEVELHPMKEVEEESSIPDDETSEVVEFDTDTEEELNLPLEEEAPAELTPTEVEAAIEEAPDETSTMVNQELDLLFSPTTLEPVEAVAPYQPEFILELDDDETPIVEALQPISQPSVPTVETPTTPEFRMDVDQTEGSIDFFDDDFALDAVEGFDDNDVSALQTDFALAQKSSMGLQSIAAKAPVVSEEATEINVEEAVQGSLDSPIAPDFDMLGNLGIEDEEDVTLATLNDDGEVEQPPVTHPLPLETSTTEPDFDMLEDLLAEASSEAETVEIKAMETPSLPVLDDDGLEDLLEPEPIQPNTTAHSEESDEESGFDLSLFANSIAPVEDVEQPPLQPSEKYVELEEDDAFNEIEAHSFEDADIADEEPLLEFPTALDMETTTTPPKQQEGMYESISDSVALTPRALEESLHVMDLADATSFDMPGLLPEHSNPMDDLTPDVRPQPLKFEMPEVEVLPPHPVASATVLFEDEIEPTFMDDNTVDFDIDVEVETQHTPVFEVETPVVVAPDALTVAPKPQTQAFELIEEGWPVDVQSNEVVPTHNVALPLPTAHPLPVIPEPISGILPQASLPNAPSTQSWQEPTDNFDYVSGDFPSHGVDATAFFSLDDAEEDEDLPAMLESMVESTTPAIASHSFFQLDEYDRPIPKVATPSQAEPQGTIVSAATDELAHIMAATGRVPVNDGVISEDTLNLLALSALEDVDVLSEVPLPVGRCQLYFIHICGIYAFVALKQNRYILLQAFSEVPGGNKPANSTIEVEWNSTSTSENVFLVRLGLWGALLVDDDENVSIIREL
jgi:hypothetical protein